MKRLVVFLITGMVLLSAGCASNAPRPALRTRAIAVLQAGFSSEEFWPSMHAAEALTAAGLSDVVIRGLKPRLAVETDDQRRCGLSREIMRAGDLGPLAGMAKILKNPKTNAPVHVCESLFKVHQVGDLAAMRQHAASENKSEALMAAGALARAGEKGELVRIRALLMPPHSLQTRRISAWLLGQLGDKSDWRALREFAESATGSDEPLAAPFAWYALAKLGEPAAQKIVIANLSNDNKTIRTYAAQTLGVYGAPKHLPLLAEMLEDETADTRIRAAEAIVRITNRAR
ncbi:MAG: HEAT repeat domain-containing protein [Lentisphaeria bacterium]|nr:HEAT repeat domain-containing protein [Lentisphaeria bacterium]